MKRVSLIGTVALGLALPCPAAWAQQPVFCVNCSTFVEDLKDYAQQVMMYAEEVQTQLNTLNFYKNAVQNTISLPQKIYQDITGQVGQITGLMKLATMTGGYSGGMLTGLSDGSFALQKVANFPTLVANESKAAGNALMQAGRAMDLLPDQLDESSASLASIHDQAFDSDSRNAILQAHTGVSATNAQVNTADVAVRTSGMQALLTIEAARQEKDSYIVALTDAHQKAGIKAACGQVTGGLVVPACQE